MLDIFCCGQIKVFVWKILAQTNIRGPRMSSMPSNGKYVQLLLQRVLILRALHAATAIFIYL